jgi:ParB/RepB/Spo0J family partition protein
VSLSMLNPAELVLAPYNPRKSVSDEGLAQLAESIKKQGLLQPVLVREVDGHYEVVCGSRRTRAAILAGLSAIPCSVGEMSDQEAIEAALTENMERVDVEPLEEVAAIVGLSRFYDTDQAVADRLSRGVDWVSRRRKLLDLTPALMESLGRKEFPLSWYELACRLEPIDQERVLELARGYNGIDNAVKLRAYIGRHGHLLEKAPFDTTVPMGQRPACTACPRNTATQSDLFGADEPARCQNRACFDEKASYHAQRVANETGVPLMRITYTDSVLPIEREPSPEEADQFQKIVVAAASDYGLPGEVRYLRTAKKPEPVETEERKAYLAACKKENWIRAEMLNLLATNISTMDELDAGHCISSLRYILHRGTKTAGPPSKDSAVSHYSQFMEKAMVTPFIPGSQEYVSKRALLAFLIWRACHEELAQKDWPKPGDAPQNCPALFEAYDALNMNYAEYRADFEQAWERLLAKEVVK